MSARRLSLRVVAASATVLGTLAAVAFTPPAQAAGVLGGTVTYITVVFSPFAPTPDAYITLACTGTDGTVQSHDLHDIETGDYNGPCTFSAPSHVPSGYTASVDGCDQAPGAPGDITETFPCVINVHAPGVADGLTTYAGAIFHPGPPQPDSFVTLSCTKEDGTVQTSHLHHGDPNLAPYVGPCVFSVSNVPAGYTVSLAPCDTSADPPNTTEFFCWIDVTLTTTATFDQPIDGAGVINLVKSGRVVPVKATITGASGSVTSGTVAVLANTVSCISTDATDSIEVYSSPGATGRSNLMIYNTSTGRWQFNFDTSAFGLKVVGSCYKVDLHLGATDPDNDGKYTGGTVVGSFLIRLTK